MDFMEILSGPGNRFDAGLTHGVRETKALRDAILYIQKRIVEIEARLSPVTKELREMEEEGQDSLKKRGRPKKHEG